MDDLGLALFFPNLQIEGDGSGVGSWPSHRRLRQEWYPALTLNRLKQQNYWIELMNKWVCLKMVSTPTPNGSWSLSLLNGYNWGYTPFSDKPKFNKHYIINSWMMLDISGNTTTNTNTHLIFTLLSIWCLNIFGNLRCLIEYIRVESRHPCYGGNVVIQVLRPRENRSETIKDWDWSQVLSKQYVWNVSPLG